MSRRSLGDRITLLCRPPVPVVDAVREAAGRAQAQTVSDWVATLICLHVDMPELAPSTHSTLLPVAPPQGVLLTLDHVGSLDVGQITTRVARQAGDALRARARAHGLSVQQYLSAVVAAAVGLKDLLPPLPPPVDAGVDRLPLEEVRRLRTA